jgi:hypothetical protein
VPRAIAVVVIAVAAALLGLLAGGAWGYGGDVCEGLSRLRALTDRIGDVRGCACAVVDSLRRAEPDAFVFDVTGDRGVARVVVRSSFDVASGVQLFRAVTVITRDEDVVVDNDALEAL